MPIFRRGKLSMRRSKSSHTRLPLWRGEREEIIGVLHAKNSAAAPCAMSKGDLSKLDVLALATPPWFVPDTTTLKDQLNAFLKRKAHFAVVVDEYGEVMGLVTLEDIIEEIVGDITDETDIASSLAKPQADGSLIVDGSVPIRDVNRLMEWDIPEEEATTIAGLVHSRGADHPRARGRPSPSMASASRCCGGSGTASRLPACG